MPEERWSEVLQVIDKSEREPREKTAERLGPLAEPVFEILDGGGRSEKLDASSGSSATAGWPISSKSISRLSAGSPTTPALSSKSFDRGGELRAIAGGGRYDNLIAQLSDGAVSLPAIGFAMGDVVLGDLIRRTPPASSDWPKR